MSSTTHVHAVLGMLASLALAVSPAFHATAHADGDGYTDNFPGAITVRYASRESINAPWTYPTPPNPFPSPTPLKTLFDQKANQNFCNRISDKFAGPDIRNLRCSLGTSELRVKQLTSPRNQSEISLKYLLLGNRIQFTKHNPWLVPDIKIDASFDVEFKPTLVFGPAVDGGVTSSSAEYENGPIWIPAETAKYRVTNVRYLVNPRLLFPNFRGRAEDASFDAADLLSQEVKERDRELNKLAKSIGDYLRLAKPASNWYFNVDATLQQTAIVVRLRRDFDLPPVPTGCTGKDLPWVRWVEVKCASGVATIPAFLTHLAGTAGPGGVKL